jgi:hypothetical protein
MAGGVAVPQSRALSMLGAGASIPSKPGKPATPRTTVINGQTYTYAGQKPPAGIYGGHDYQMGDQLGGPDGSLWAPMPSPMTTAAGPRPTGQPPGGDLPDIDLERYLPKPVPREALPPRVTPGPEADRTGADNAHLAKAKSRIGQTLSGALKALSRNMQSRGISGSGLESAGASRLIRGAAGDVGGVVNDLTIDDLRRKDAVNDRNYAGDLTQRSGDMNFGVTQRGQDVNFNLARANMIPALLQLARRQGGVIY